LLEYGDALFGRSCIKITNDRSPGLDGAELFGCARSREHRELSIRAIAQGVNCPVECEYRRQ